MTLSEATSQLTTAANAVTNGATQIRLLFGAIARLRLPSPPRTDYENLRLDLMLDLDDATGAHAVLGRRQRIQFHIPDTGVVRDLVWGEGNQLAHYTANGAKRIFERSEGSRRAVMLGLAHRPARGECATIATRRVIKQGFLSNVEYWEAVVERPTKQLSLTVLFPQHRSPLSVRLMSAVTPDRPRNLLVRWTANGRPFVCWRCRRPVEGCVYRLWWSW